MESGNCYRCGSETRRYSQHNERWWCGCLPKEVHARKYVKKIKSGRWLPLLKEHEGQTLFVGIYRKSKPSDVLYLPHAIPLEEQPVK